jgi:AcrR family transcriptional regulator
VVAALLDCVADGEFDPSAETVAQRAGVGLRTVFRLFSDKETLISQVSQAVLSRIADLASAPLRGATWRERLEDMMTRRFAAFEQVMPYRRAGQAHAHHSPFVRMNNQAMTQALRETLAGVLPPELSADRDAFEALDMALCVDAWIRLRVDQRLEPASARTAVRRMVAALTAGVE